jgi:hypothetical protein
MPEKAIDIFRRFASAGCLKVFSIVNVKWSMHNFKPGLFCEIYLCRRHPYGTAAWLFMQKNIPRKSIALTPLSRGDLVRQKTLNFATTVRVTVR